MALFYGKQSNYLVLNKKISKLGSLSWLILLCITLFIVLNHWIVNWFSLPSLIALLTVFGPILLFIDHQLKKEKSLLFRFASGLRGEGSIWYELHKLNDEYVVIQDIKLPGTSENIDFVVAGPTGIFTIEVKNHGGVIGFNGSELIQNGKKFEKDFIKQSMHQAISLHDYLLTTCGVDMFITPFLVFSHPFARVYFGHSPVKNIHIIHRRWVISEIKSKSSSKSINPLIIEKIKALGNSNLHL